MGPALSKVEKNNLMGDGWNISTSIAYNKANNRIPYLRWILLHLWEEYLIFPDQEMKLTLKNTTSDETEYKVLIKNYISSINLPLVPSNKLARTAIYLFLS